MKSILKLLIKIGILFTIILGILKITGIQNRGWIAVFTPLILALILIIIVNFITNKSK
jgi:hypothetical protein